MKYYIGEIDNCFGESEVSSVIKFKTAGDPEHYLDDIASKFWGDGEDMTEDTDSGLYDFGHVTSGSGRYQQVTKEVFDSLTIIPTL
jgi:hypothetical protein